MARNKHKRGIAAVPKSNKGTKGQKDKRTKGQPRFSVNETATDNENAQIVFSLERVISNKYCFSKLNKDHK